MTEAMDISIASTIRRAVRRGGVRFWRSEEFEGGRTAVEHALSRLASEGELIRIRRGLYWRGRKSAFGMGRPLAMDLARAVIDSPGIGPAGWSATNALGLSTQLPGRETIAVPSRAPSGLEDILWVSRDARRARRDQKLSPIEVALLEALEGFEDYVDLPPEKAVARLLEILLSDDVRPERLVRAAKTEPARTRRRLRDLLVRAGLTDAADRVPPARTARSIPALAVA